MDEKAFPAWKVGVVFGAALLVLAVFQSSALLTLSYDLDVNEMTLQLIAAVEYWHGWMIKMGFVASTEIVREELFFLRNL